MVTHRSTTISNFVLLLTRKFRYSYYPLHRIPPPLRPLGVVVRNRNLVTVLGRINLYQNQVDDNKYSTSIMSWSAPPSSPAPPVLASSKKTKPAAGLDHKALLYMGLLALQFGIQPLLTRKFIPKGICGSSVILAQEVVKFGLAYFMLTVSGAKKSSLAGTLGKSNNNNNNNNSNETVCGYRDASFEN
jgi:hypothetical protein